MTWDPKTQDPRALKLQEPSFWDPGPQDSGSHDTRTGTWEPEPEIQDLRTKTWDPGTLNFLIELQNKTLKSNKTLTSNCDEAKYPFTYFSLIKNIGFFLELRFVSEIFRKILDTLDFCLSDLSRWNLFS